MINFPINKQFTPSISKAILAGTKLSLLTISILGAMGAGGCNILALIVPFTGEYNFQLSDNSLTNGCRAEAAGSTKKELIIDKNYYTSNITTYTDSACATPDVTTSLVYKYSAGTTKLSAEKSLGGDTVDAYPLDLDAYSYKLTCHTQSCLDTFSTLHNNKSYPYCGTLVMTLNSEIEYSYCYREINGFDAFSKLYTIYRVSAQVVTPDILFPGVQVNPGTALAERYPSLIEKDGKSTQNRYKVLDYVEYYQRKGK